MFMFVRIGIKCGGLLLIISKAYFSLVYLLNIYIPCGSQFVTQKENPFWQNFLDKTFFLIRLHF